MGTEAPLDSLARVDAGVGRCNADDGDTALKLVALC